MKVTDEKLAYRTKLLLAPWKKKREQILIRDNHQCRNCKSKSRLEIHHRQYHINPVTGSKREPWEYDNKYLVTLCADCHSLGHQQYQIISFKY